MKKLHIRTLENTIGPYARGTVFFCHMSFLPIPHLIVGLLGAVPPHIKEEIMEEIRQFIEDNLQEETGKPGLFG